MKHLAFILILLMYSPALFCQHTIERCQQLTRQNYPLIKQYGLIEKSREYSLSNASRGYLPQFSLSAKASYQTDVVAVPLPGVKSLAKDQYQAVVQLDQVVWDAGAIGSQRRAIEALAQVDQSRLTVDLYALNERVNALFFGILLLDEQLQLNGFLVEELGRNYDKVSAYICSGIANDADLDAVRVEQLTACQQQSQINATRRAYQNMLTAMVGEPVELLVRPAISQPQVTQNNRPELMLFDAQQAQIESERAAITSKNLPKISAFIQGAYGNPGLNMFKAGFTPYAIGGVSLSWKFGGLYTRHDDIAKIENSKRMIETNRNVFLYNTNLSLEQTDGEIVKLREQIAQDDEIILLRESIKLAAQAKVAEGTMSVIDMLREVTAESTARQSRTLHQIELIKAIYNIKNTINNY